MMKDMAKGYELRVRICPYCDIDKNYINSSIGNFINNAMEHNDFLKELHNSKGLKGYCISTPVPFEKDFYREAELYDVFIRTSDLRIIQNLKMALNGFDNEKIFVLDLELKIQNLENKTIDYIDVITPAVATLKENNKTLSWTKKHDEEFLKKAIVGNLIKKSGEEIVVNYEDIIQGLVFKNERSIKILYKNNSGILGYKYKIYFKNNEIAQKLAKVAYFQGVLTKNSSLCCGFTKAFYKESDFV